ncbi:PAS domain-containing sensor histidine kinase [Haloferula helveola]|uniref:histidine kinase n=1 Tax=Haloferula helveola TaxID=490095 RepID=A0ABM7RJ24_9BACT|nr:PAS domain-containing sensor histidine kinase [Haloferula helveola]
MLRTRLLFGLLTLVILLWAVGAAGLLILRHADENFQTRLTQDYEAIDTAHSFRAASSMINSTYAITLADEPPEEPLDQQLYEETMADFDKAVAKLRKIGKNNSRWGESIDQLEDAIGQYRGAYRQLFSGEVVDQDERAQLLVSIGNQTQRITDLAQNLESLAEERLFAATHALSEESGKNTLFVATLVILGTGIATLIYFQLLRHLVDPVVGLRDSIEEVSMGNFELTLPAPSKGSEFSSLVTAFNSMAAELRVRRRETDQHLLRNNLVNRALLSAIPSPVYVLDTQGETVQLNPAAEDLNESLALGSRLPNKVSRLFKDCQKNGENLLPEDPREALLFRIKEEESYYLPRIFRFSAESGEYSGWAVLLHDVTRIRWLDDMKTNMLSTVSHEIKTPLTGIRMVLHLLLEEHSGKLTDMQKQMLGSANDDCERLLTTLNTLLDLSRAESGTTHLDRTSIDLEEIARSSANLFESKAGASDIKIALEPSDDIPPVFADPVRIAEVVHNLVSNAIKHSPNGGTVHLSLARRGADYLRLSVADEGPGVPDDLQGRIFERFFRAPGQKSDGVGLGLFISREIMRAHEGRIGLAERNENQNRTEFFIDVPIA